MDPPVDGIPARLVRFTAELTCLLCGRTLGTLDGGSSWPPRREALLYLPGLDQPMQITGWWKLRCTSCGGALMASEVTSHSTRPDAAVDWTTKGIPRGRPPNWLVQNGCRKRGLERVMTRICDRAVLDQQAG